jgi:hypothetical protein
MKNVFLTEMPFEGKIPNTFTNMRVEFAWMTISDALHVNIWNYKSVVGFDNVYIIIPKGKFNLSVEGSEIANFVNPVSSLLEQPFIEELKEKNSRIIVVQEGPAEIFNDWGVVEQFNWYTRVSQADAIMCHNQVDKSFYEGLFPHLPVSVIFTKLIDTLIHTITPEPQDKTIIGGNFSRWYGGFQSYVVASEFDNPIWVQSSHSRRPNEDSVTNLQHLPRLEWIDWMKELSKFKYAVHLMPTVAAGTFSLNCAYFGIPCIGNRLVDTQRVCFPELSVDVQNVRHARELAIRLKEDSSFYEVCSNRAKEMAKWYVSNGSGGTLDGVIYDE